MSYFENSLENQTKDLTIPPLDQRGKYKLLNKTANAYKI